MILKIFSPKNRGENDFFVQNTASFCKNFDHITLVIIKNANFSPKIGENRRQL
jgi:hypothetical protein